MAGRGRSGRAAFPEIRHQLRRPKDEVPPQNESHPGVGDVKKEQAQPPISTVIATGVEDDDIKKLCQQFKYLQASDTNFTKHLASLRGQIKTEEDVAHVAECIYDLGRLGPDQAEVASVVAVELADIEIGSSRKLRFKILSLMQRDFEGFEEKAKSSPDSVLCSTIFLCEFYTRYLLFGGEPLEPLREPLWKYFEFMLQSRKQYFTKHCLRLVRAKGAFLRRHDPNGLESFLVHLRELILEGDVERTTRSATLETLEFILREVMPPKTKDSHPPL
ncbi:unnamed protein product [Ixodes hexagonus]